MPPVTPRWEWRSFGDGFESVERLMLATPHDVRRSRETYLLSDTSDLSVQIRAGQLDVKELQRTDGGLELWAPVLKAPFPADRDAIRTLFARWSLALPGDLEGSGAEVIGRIAAAYPDVHPIYVDKTGHTTVVDGCTVELASIVVNGHRLRTAAVKMEDPDRVRHTARVLGLSGHGNVNYLTALGRILDTDRRTIEPNRTLGP